MDKAFLETVFEYHKKEPRGKFQTRPSKPLHGPEDLALAYTPGVGAVCEAIAADPARAYDYTTKGHLVAVISNGTAVLGLGNIGALAGKPVMEGKAVLFQHFAKLDAVDIEIEEQDPKKLVEIIASLAPSFGGINLEDIKAPDCFLVEESLQQRLSIPVFHDDQHGTAITVGAAMMNALSLVDVPPEEAKGVVLGAGAGALACIHLLVDLGVKKENIWVFDSKGLVCTSRNDLSSHKKKIAQEGPPLTLQEALTNSHFFLGLSGPNTVQKQDITDMAADPIVMALANPVPEIYPNDVFSIRPDALMGTGRSDYPNQVNNSVCFPYLFRGILDAGIPQVTKEIKIALVKALCHLTQRGFVDVWGSYDGHAKAFGREYFIPSSFDPRLLAELPLAVAEEGLRQGIAKEGFCLKTYRKHLITQAYETLPFLGKALCSSKGISEDKVYYAYDPANEKLLGAIARAVHYHFPGRVGFVGDVDRISAWISGDAFLEGCDVKATIPVGTRVMEPFKKGCFLRFHSRKGVPCFFFMESSQTLYQFKNEEDTVEKLRSAQQALTRWGWRLTLVGEKAVPYGKKLSLSYEQSFPEVVMEDTAYLFLQGLPTAPFMPGLFSLDTTLPLPTLGTFRNQLQDGIETTLFSIGGVLRDHGEAVR